MFFSYDYLEMELYTQSVQKLMKRWYSREAAQRILTKKFQSAGIFKAGTQQMTDAWYVQEAKTEQQRQIERYAKKLWVNPRKVRLRLGKPVLIGTYKK